MMPCTDDGSIWSATPFTTGPIGAGVDQDKPPSRVDSAKAWQSTSNDLHSWPRSTPAVAEANDRPSGYGPGGGSPTRVSGVGVADAVGLSGRVERAPGCGDGESTDWADGGGTDAEALATLDSLETLPPVGAVDGARVDPQPLRATSVTMTAHTALAPRPMTSQTLYASDGLR